MASGKIGSLVYDVIADTRQFTKGLVPAKKELTAFNRMMINTRTPMEKLGIEFDGIARVARSGLAPIDALSRTVGQLAVETKGGGREARKFAESLREEARRLFESEKALTAKMKREGETRKLSDTATRKRIVQLHNTAKAIDAEVDSRRNAIAQNLRANRANEQQAAADKKAAAAAREAATAEAARRKQIEQTITARQRAVQQESAARTSRVQSMVAATESPQLALSRQLSEARQERDAGNISQKQFLAVQQNIVAEAKKLNPIYEQQAQKIKQQKDAAEALLKRQKAIADAATKAQQQSRQKGIDAAKGIASQGEAARLSRVRSEVEATVPAAKKLTARMAEVRQELAAGNITQEQFARVQKRIARELHELSPAFAKQQKEAAESDARMQKLRATYASLVTPQQAVQNELNDLQREFRAGNITGEMHTKLLTHLTRKYDALRPEVVEANAQLERVRRTVERSISPIDRLEKEEQELHAEFRKGKVDAKSYERALKMLRSEKQKLIPVTEKQTKTEKGLSSQLVAIGKHIGFITAGYAALRQARLSISDALELERSQKQFEVFTGSVDQSKKLIADLRDFSARTPLTFAGSQQAVKTLMQYGVSVDDVMTRLKQLGDVSGGSLESLQRLSLAFGQINANTRLQGQELRQLIEAGFNPLKVISEQTGESMQSLRDRMADGKLSFQEFANALRDATSEGGRFHDMLKTIGEDTAFGKIQVFKGEIEKLRADLGANAAEASGEIAGVMTSGLQRLRNLAKESAKGSETTVKATTRGLTTAANAFFPPFILYNEALAFAFQSMEKAERKSLAIAKKAKNEVLDLTEVLKTDAEKKQELFDASDAGAAIRKRLRDLNLERKQLGMTADEKEIAAAKEAGASKVTVKMLEVELRLLAMAKQERKEKAELAEKEAKAVQDQIKAEEKRKKSIQDFAKTLGEEINKSTIKPLDKFIQDINAINVLMQQGFISHAEARQLRNQREKNFLDENKKEIAGTQSATAATAGSREEFQLLAQINRQNRDTQRRHNEAQALREKMFGALRDNAGAVNNLPAALAELFPEPVGE